MNELNEQTIKDLLKQSLPPVNEELERDLWPQMLRRIDERPLRKTVPWFDWALAGGLVVVACAFPGSIPLLLYHL